jgi:hypothetical protein
VSLDKWIGSLAAHSKCHHMLLVLEIIKQWYL